MGRGVFVANNGRWTPLRFPYVTVGGQQVKIKAGYTYVNGDWRQFWPPALPVTLVLMGAGGGRGGDDVTAGYAGNPGHRVSGTLGLSSSDNIIIGVGGVGGSGSGGGMTSAPGGAGGFGGPIYGGGPGGTAGPYGWSGGGGGGGGATYLEVDGNAIIVAAGGGGGGGGGWNYVPPPPPPEPIPEPWIPPPAAPSPETSAPPPAPPAPPPPPPEPEPPPPDYYEYFGGDGIGDGGTGGDSGGAGGSGCFIGTTEILMANGTLKKISQIRVGDKLQSDQGTVSVLTNRDRYGDVELISINGSVHYMTSNHAVLTDQGWAVYDIDLLQSTESVLYEQILADNDFKPLIPLRAGLSLAHWTGRRVEYRLIETLTTIKEKNAHVYWLNVTGDNHYVANGIVVHNDS